MASLFNSVERDGIALHWRSDGPEDGAPVLFANSLGTDMRVWDPLLPYLPAGLRVIRFDKPGHGLSGTRAGAYRIHDLVADAAAVLNAAEVREASVVGLSIGGMIAQGLAAEAPERVRALALLDTGAKIGTPEMWAERIAALRADGLESMADAIMERWFSATFRAAEPSVGLWRTMVTRTQIEGYIGCCEAIAAADLTVGTRAILKPALCVVGTADGSTPPETVKALADLIPGATYAEIEGVGHIPCVEAPERLAAHLSPFLKEHCGV
ncbi:MAG: 3-oxoadipate enol-lactonase [Pseudomonadota bacterium]